MTVFKERVFISSIHAINLSEGSFMFLYSSYIINLLYFSYRHFILHNASWILHFYAHNINKKYFLVGRSEVPIERA